MAARERTNANEPSAVETGLCAISAITILQSLTLACDVDPGAAISSAPGANLRISQPTAQLLTQPSPGLISVCPADCPETSCMPAFAAVFMAGDFTHDQLEYCRWRESMSAFDLTPQDPV